MGQFSETVLENGVCVVAASGEVDLAVADELVDVASAGLQSASGLHLDLREVSFIDSTGLGALVTLRNEAARATKPFVLVNVPRAVARLLELTGLQSAFEIEGTDPS
jgi:anti-sigma B factor antagonist